MGPGSPASPLNPIPGNPNPPGSPCRKNKPLFVFLNYNFTWIINVPNKVATNFLKSWCMDKIAMHIHITTATATPIGKSAQSS